MFEIIIKVWTILLDTMLQFERQRNVIFRHKFFFFSILIRKEIGTHIHTL